MADLTSVCSLSGLRDLRDLYLTGNPCADYEYYREYVVTVLPQLAQLDGIAITRTERIVARQKWAEVAVGCLLMLTNVACTAAVDVNPYRTSDSIHTNTMSMYLACVCVGSLLGDVVFSYYGR